MDRLEELIAKHFDDALPPAEASELVSRLRADRGAAQTFVALHRQESVLKELHRAATDEVVDAIMAEITASERTFVGTVMEAVETSTQRKAPSTFTGLQEWLRTAIRPRIVFPLAASIALLMGLSLWLFGPTMGEPVLADVKGAGATIERGTEFIPAPKGTSLQTGDTLHTGTNATVKITFGSERTWLTLNASGELKLNSLRSGKRFHLNSGTLDADVARQRPFNAMIVTTPNARARVLGTHFTLTARTNHTRLEVAEGEVRLTDTRSDEAEQVPAGYYAEVAEGTKLAALPQTGWILREYWTNLPGKFAQVIDFKTFPEFPDPRNKQEWLSRLETANGWGENYAARWRGYVHPPISGRYEISLSASDEAFLFLSRDDQPKHAASLIAQKTQNSQSFELEAGHRYYIEVLHKAGEGLDYLSVNWKRPDGKVEVITGEYLSPFKPKLKDVK